MHDPALAQILGVAGEFLPVDGDVVAAVDLRMDTQSRQGTHHRLTEQVHIQSSAACGIGDEGEVQIAHVVIHRAAAGQPPHHPDAPALHGLQVDLGQGVLILADDDGIVILPEHKVHPIPGQTVKDVLLHSQVIAGIGGGQI